MQILKSVLVVVLLSFCAFQSNANVLPVVSSSIEIGGIIEWESTGRTVSVKINTLELVEIYIINSNNEVVYQDILTDNQKFHIIDLQHLPLGIYKFSATCLSVTVSGDVIIE